MRSHHPKTVWFPAKKYGWGWGFPCAWQGWVVMLAYIGLISAGSFAYDPASPPWIWVVGLVGLTLVLFLICWWKGEKPSWRWGDPK
jgi:hypothetical protein